MAVLDKTNAIREQNRERRTIHHWALAGCWEGSFCAIYHGNYVPPFARWFLVSEKQYRELKAGGFYVRRSASRPLDYLSDLDKAEQRAEPKLTEVPT